MKKILSLLLVIAMMALALAIPAFAEETDSRYVVIDELTQSATLIVEPAVDPNAVAMLADGPAFHTLAEAVAAAQAIPEDQGRPAVLVLKDCEITQPIPITDGMVNIFPSEFGVPRTISSSADSAFTISNDAVLVINDLNVTTTGKYVFHITGGASGMLLGGNTGCNISGATEAAIYVAEGVLPVTDGANVAVYNTSISGAAALKMKGSNVRAEIVSSGTFASTGSEGAFILDGDGIAVDVMMANITGSSAFSMNGDSRLSLNGVTFNGEGKYNDPHQQPYAVPGTGAAARVDVNYFGSLDAALEAAAALNYEDPNAVLPLTILQDLSISGETLSLDAKHPVKLNLAGHTLTIEEGAGLKVNQQTQLHNGTIFVSLGAELNGDITPEATGNIIRETLPTGSFGKVDFTLTLEGVVYMEFPLEVEGFDGIDLAEKGGVVVWTGETAPASASQLVVGGENCIYLDNMYWSTAFEKWTVTSPGINAKQYGDKIYVRPCVEVAENVYVYRDKGTAASPKMYCEQKLTGGQTGKLQDACAALLEYGAAAQEYFDYKLDAMVNVSNKFDLSIYDLAFNEDMIDPLVNPTPDKYNTLTGIKANVGSSKATLSLMGAIVLEVIYPNVNVEDIASAELLVWTKADYDAAETLAYEAETYSYTVPLKMGELADTQGYVASSQGIPAKEIGDTIYYSARFVTESGEVYRSGLTPYSPEKYINEKLTNTDTELVNAVKTLAVYGEKARVYFDSLK